MEQLPSVPGFQALSSLCFCEALCLSLEDICCDSNGSTHLHSLADKCIVAAGKTYQTPECIWGGLRQLSPGGGLPKPGCHDLGIL